MHVPKLFDCLPITLTRPMTGHHKQALFSFCSADDIFHELAVLPHRHQPVLHLRLGRHRQRLVSVLADLEHFQYVQLSLAPVTPVRLSGLIRHGVHIHQCA